VRGLAGEQSLIERLLDRIEHLRLRLRQVAREVAQERFLGETSFIAVENDAGRCRRFEATASGSVVSGFCTAVTLSPASCNRAIISDQHDPSANSPCTSTTLRACVGGESAAMPRVEISEAAAPATRAADRVRLVIIMILASQS